MARLIVDIVVNGKKHEYEVKNLPLVEQVTLTPRDLNLPFISLKHEEIRAIWGAIG